MVSEFEKHYSMQGARIWLPNIAGFFMSLLSRLLESAEVQRNTAGFFSCCLRENERTLVILTLTIGEAFPNEVEVNI